MPVFTLSTLLLAEGGGASLTNIDFNLFVWTLVLFALFAWVLSKFGWGPLLASIDAREKSVRDEVEGARTEADLVLERAREQIQRERDAAITVLRGQVADVAILAAAKIVESSLTKDAQKKIVDEFVASLESQQRPGRA